MALAPPGGPTPAPVLLSHDGTPYPALIKPTGAGLGPQHADLAALIEAGSISTFGQW